MSNSLSLLSLTSLFERKHSPQHLLASPARRPGFQAAAGCAPALLSRWAGADPPKAVAVAAAWSSSSEAPPLWQGPLALRPLWATDGCLWGEAVPGQERVRVRWNGGNSSWKAGGDVGGESQQVGTWRLGDVEAAGRVILLQQACSIFIFLSGCVSLIHLLFLSIFQLSKAPREGGMKPLPGRGEEPGTRSLLALGENPKEHRLPARRRSAGREAQAVTSPSCQ